MEDRRRQAGLGWLLAWAFFLFLVLFGAYLVVELVPSEYLGGVDRVRIVSERLNIVGAEAWRFGRPILQLIVILVVLEWILMRAGFTLDLSEVRFTSDIRAVLALLVVAAFALAALSGSPSSGALEEVCLVVVGFYFGGLTKSGSSDSSSKGLDRE